MRKVTTDMIKQANNIVVPGYRTSVDSTNSSGSGSFMFSSMFTAFVTETNAFVTAGSKAVCVSVAPVSDAGPFGGNAAVIISGGNTFVSLDGGFVSKDAAVVFYGSSFVKPSNVYFCYAAVVVLCGSTSGSRGSMFVNATHVYFCSGNAPVSITGIFVRERNAAVCRYWVFVSSRNSFVNATCVYFCPGSSPDNEAGTPDKQKDDIVKPTHVCFSCRNVSDKESTMIGKSLTTSATGGNVSANGSGKTRKANDSFVARATMAVTKMDKIKRN
jgi:hypothetical protein